MKDKRKQWYIITHLGHCYESISLQNPEISQMYPESGKQYFTIMNDLEL